jgi:hypothetical protein
MEPEKGKLCAKIMHFVREIDECRAEMRRTVLIKLRQFGDYA